MFEGNEEYGFSVDVYSFAILAYEIVTGKDSLEDSYSDSFYALCKKVTPLHVNGSLADLISAVAKGNAPRNWETIKAISILGIAAGIASMHQHRIILGDLRPESVFFDQDFHPKIGGFANAVSIKNGKKRNVPQKLLNAIAVYKAP